MNCISEIEMDIIEDFPILYQHGDAMDCGMVCLMMIAQYYGVDNTCCLSHKKHFNEKGLTFLDLQIMAIRLGFKATGKKLTLNQFRKIFSSPCILHWNGNHYVVCYTIKAENNMWVYYIADPRAGKKKICEEDLRNHWLCTGQDIGFAMELKPILNNSLI
jgi:ATP-binding cassette subfamily B protein